MAEPKPGHVEPMPDLSAAAHLALAARVEALSGDDQPWRSERALNVEILRIHTGKPWYPLTQSGSEYAAVTWDQYTPGAPGNPVCSMPDYTRDIAEATSLLPDGVRLTLEQGDDAETWTATARFVVAPPGLPPVVATDTELPRLITAVALRARAALAD
jgi:hypothetical protein